MRETVHVLPVVLDPQRVLADEVAPEFFYGRLGSLKESSGAGLAEAAAPRIGFDRHTEIAVEHQSRHLGDCHGFEHICDLRAPCCVSPPDGIGHATPIGRTVEHTALMIDLDGAQ